MEYAFEPSGTDLLIRITGRMTHADYRGFRDILGQVNTRQPERLVFDLKSVEFIDSSALGMMLIVRDAVVQQQRSVVLRGASGQVENLIHIGKLHKYFTVD